MAIIYRLGITSADAITLYCEKPEIGKKQTTLTHRSDIGIIYQNIINAYHSIKLSLEYVPASQAAIVNSWWESQALLLFMITSDTATDVRSIMIIGKEIPFVIQAKPNDTLFQGTIKLEGY